MARNLDMTALRSFVTVADAGGVTKAAGVLHLTQSAVSMQLKRLEESLGASLLDRSARQIGVTPEGEQLLSYARRMLALNDEALQRLTADDFEGEITLGVPHDIIDPYIPAVLRRFASDFPRMKIHLVSEPTRVLREMFDRGECDAIITTEAEPGPGGESLVTLPLVWVGSQGGNAWKQRPLPVAFCSNCIFRAGVLKRMDDAKFEWEMIVDSHTDTAIQAVVSADLAVHAVIKGVYARQTVPIPAEANLPDPGKSQIVLYMQSKADPVQAALYDMIRHSYMSEWAVEDARLRA
ncbi:LysR family transcriptional regulator [Octadecabacter sp. 1_MG-2023]|uniref:LysR family transcriptional regulator n=1 Tax=unclassified Octadecabacter TaxID=196158 RepID=UPI001C0A1819|nr:MULTISPECIES: LysR family transcriptional regulator [unclassified Octadecabacter]MBU2992719.1 LysR family transcriptional regulator [Octadecabacter sp. B2R22]MDO6733830.1 LysR family transcriptional regulator [Octadecabacter sp. 1_MG-2023]